MVKKIIGNIITALLLILIVSQIVLLLLGFKLMVVKTGSMNPDIPQGSLIYIKNYNTKEEFYENIKIGDDITYKTSSGVVVTHRIISLDSDNNKITTQGIIENATVDAPISYENVLGKVRFSIPVIGYVVMFMQTWYFWVIFIYLIAIIMISKYLYKEIKKNKKEEVK